jgi:outer membrane protein TolC
MNFSEKVARVATPVCVGLVVVAIIGSASGGKASDPEDSGTDQLASLAYEPSVGESTEGLVAALEELGISPRDSLGVRPDLADYVGYAALHNQDVVSAWQTWRAAMERAPQVSHLPDPQFSYVEQLESVETRVGPQERSFSLRQTIPWFGTLGLRRRVADERAAGERAGVTAAVLGVVYRVTKAYYDLVFLARATDITTAHLDLMTQWEEVARSRYATGGAAYTDVIKAQVEIGKLGDRLAELHDRRRPLVATFNAVLDRPPDAVVFIPNEASERDEIPTALDGGELRRRLAQSNPELIRLRHSAESFVYAEDLAGKQRLPDFTLGVNYVQTGDARMEGVPDSGKDPIMASLAVSIPLWQGSYAAAEREAASQYLAVSARRSERRNLLQARLEGALFDYRDAVRKRDLYGDTLLPKGRQSLGATRAAYEVGEASFLDLVDAERVLLEFELAFAQARRDLAVNQADIEMLTGGPLAGSPRRSDVD